MIITIILTYIYEVYQSTVRLIKKFTFRTVAILSKYVYLRSSSYIPYFTLTPYVRTYLLEYGYRLKFLQSLAN